MKTFDSLWDDDFGRIRYEYAKRIGREKELSQEEAGAMLGIDQSQWSRYERGKAEPPLELIKRMATVFDDYELRLALGGLQFEALMNTFDRHEQFA